MHSVVGTPTDGGRVTITWTERSDGDLSIDAPDVASLRPTIVDRPWVWVRQVHGDAVVVVEDGPLDAACGVAADALVTRRRDVAIAVQSADCATIGLWSDDHVLAAVHCGWRGFEVGVLDATIDAMRELTDAPIRAVLGPSIGPECYEFGVDDLERLRARFGDVIVGETADGRPALDLRAGLRGRLDELGIDLVAADDRCTACEADVFHSHRARGDAGRQALVVWVDR